MHRPIKSPWGACLTTPILAEQFPANAPLIICSAPKLAFAMLAQMLHISLEGVSTAPQSSPQIDPSAFVHPSAVVASGAKIGANVHLGANCYVGIGVQIGANSQIRAGVCVMHAHIGEDVCIGPNSTIGDDGFGFVPVAEWFDAGPAIR